MSSRSRALPRLLTFSLPLLALTACHDDPIPPAATVYNHTVVAYMVAENSLSSLLNQDLKEMIEGSKYIPSDAQMLVFIDDKAAPRLYRLTAKQDSVRLYTWPADICATDSASACDVLGKVKEYAAGCERFDLIMSSHASGWVPAVNHHYTRSFGIDNNANSNANNGVEMDIPVLRDVVQTKLGHVGYIFFDACYMQCIEVAHELRHVADYIVASPTEIPGAGAQYANMIQAFFAQDAPVSMVEQYYADQTSSDGVVISAVKTSETQALAMSMQPIIGQLCAERTTPSTAGVQAYGPYSYISLYRPCFYDMLGIALQSEDEAALNAFRLQLERTVVAYRATATWLTAFPYLFDASITDITRTCGVSMFLPDERYEAQDWNNLYHYTEWYKDAGYMATGW